MASAAQAQHPKSRTRVSDHLAFAIDRTAILARPILAPWQATATAPQHASCQNAPRRPIPGSFLARRSSCGLAPSKTQSRSRNRNCNTVRAVALPDAVKELEHPETLTALSRLEEVTLRPLPSHPTLEITTTFYRSSPRVDKSVSTQPVFVLLHGFDSSCLEFRRLVPALEKTHEVVAVDMLSFGFTSRPERGKDQPAIYTTQAVRDHLRSFIDTVIGSGKEIILVGASLGGAAAIDFAVEYSERVRGLVLIDAAAYVDAAPPPKAMVWPVAEIAAEVLRSVPLRRAAQERSYWDRERCATDEALKVGRVHTFVPGWKHALVEFMRSGGFGKGDNFGREGVRRIEVETLVVWGENDEVLPFEQNGKPFQSDLKKGELVIIPECGHVPHLEKPQECARILVGFANELMAAQ